MALGRKLVWDAIGTREYETGTKDVVLFVQNSSGAYSNGVATLMISHILILFQQRNLQQQLLHICIHQNLTNATVWLLSQKE